MTLLDARGRVIGINAQIRSDSGNAEGVGFAIPIIPAPLDGAADLDRQGRLRLRRRHHPGRHAGDLAPLRPGYPRGALIQPSSRCAAARAGLKGSTNQEVFNGVPINIGGDLIVGFAGRRVERAADIARIVTDSLRPGQTVSVVVLRRGKREARDGAGPAD